MQLVVDISPVSDGLDEMAVHGTNGLVQVQLKEDICPASNGPESMIVHGIMVLVGLQLDMASLTSSYGREKMTARGIVALVTLQLSMGISLVSNMRGRMAAHGTKIHTVQLKEAAIQKFLIMSSLTDARRNKYLLYLIIVVILKFISGVLARCKFQIDIFVFQTSPMAPANHTLNRMRYFSNTSLLTTRAKYRSIVLCAVISCVVPWLSNME